MIRKNAPENPNSVIRLTGVACLLVLVGLGCRPTVTEEQAKADRLWQRGKDCVEVASLTALREGLEVGKPSRSYKGFVTSQYSNFYNAEEDACYLYVLLIPAFDLNEGGRVHLLYNTFWTGPVPMAACGKGVNSCLVYGTTHQTCDECEAFIRSKIRRTEL